MGNGSPLRRQPAAGAAGPTLNFLAWTVRGWPQVFNDLSHVKMNATKSMIGHCLGAAGGMEAIATIQAIRTGWVHPTINHVRRAAALGPHVAALCAALGQPHARLPILLYGFGPSYLIGCIPAAKGVSLSGLPLLHLWPCLRRRTRSRRLRASTWSPT